MGKGKGFYFAQVEGRADIQRHQGVLAKNIFAPPRGEDVSNLAVGKGLPLHQPGEGK